MMQTFTTFDVNTSRSHLVGLHDSIRQLEISTHANHPDLSIYDSLPIHNTVCDKSRQKVDIIIMQPRTIVTDAILCSGQWL